MACVYLHVTDIMATDHSSPTSAGDAADAGSNVGSSRSNEGISGGDDRSGGTSINGGSGGVFGLLLALFAGFHLSPFWMCVLSVSYLVMHMTTPPLPPHAAAATSRHMTAPEIIVPGSPAM